MEASSPYAAAKFGSNSFARSKKGMAFNCCPDPNSSASWVYALRAPRDEVVTSSTGLSNFWIEARDSPSFSRRREAADPNAGRTFSFASAVTCSRASVSPLRQFTASSDITYWLPKAAIVPFSGLDIFAHADAQRTNFGQHGNQFIRHAVGEEVLLLVPGEVVERQHCHGLDGYRARPHEGPV